jgi:hypothetical protein
LEDFPTPWLFLAVMTTWYAVPGDKPLSDNDVCVPFTVRLGAWHPFDPMVQVANRTV